ncbi:MAG: hypothetical protein ACTS6J_03140 [Burkholderiales bacterium]
MYRTRVSATAVQTFAAASAGPALARTIGLAMLTSLAARSDPFFLTPKRAEGQALLQAVHYGALYYADLTSMVNALPYLPARRIGGTGAMVEPARDVLEPPTALDDAQ